MVDGGGGENFGETFGIKCHLGKMFISGKLGSNQKHV